MQTHAYYYTLPTLGASSESCSKGIGKVSSVRYAIRHFPHERESRMGCARKFLRKLEEGDERSESKSIKGKSVEYIQNSLKANRPQNILSCETHISYVTQNCIDHLSRLQTTLDV